MSNTYEELLNDAEETKLDDDVEELNQKIETLESQKATYEAPEELALNTGVNNELLQKMAAKLKTMPREKILQMIASLAKGNQLPDLDFSTISASGIKSNSEKLSKKIKDLKAKRTRLQSKSDKKSKQEMANEETPQEETPKEKTHKPLQEELKVSEVSEVSREIEKKPMTKNQKRRMRAKINKQKTLSEYSSADSNLDLSKESEN
jgi:hypothetical protein